MHIARKHGYNADVDAAEDIWSAGGDYRFPTSAARLGVSSDSAEDEPGGNGASAVRIWGLDANYAPIAETVALTGGGTAETTQSFLRVNSVRIVSAKAAGGHVNAGNISVKWGLAPVGDDAPYTIAHIPAGHGSAPQAIYTVPALYEQARIIRWRGSAPGAAAGDTLFGLQVRPYSATDPAWRTEDVQTVDNLAGPLFARDVSILLAAKTDIRLRVLSTDSGNLLVSGGFDLQLNGGAERPLDDLI